MPMMKPSPRGSGTLNLRAFNDSTVNLVGVSSLLGGGVPCVGMKKAPDRGFRGKAMGPAFRLVPAPFNVVPL
jgi:hypothetical protein